MTLKIIPALLPIAIMLAACTQTGADLDGPQLATATPEPAPEASAPAKVSEPKATTTAAATIAPRKQPVSTGKKPLTGACNNPANFPAWLEEFKQEARAQGIRPQTIQLALADVRYDSAVVRKDRSQDHFSKPFDDFADGKVGMLQLAAGRSAMSNNRQLLQRIEQKYGVPPAVLVAFWGLESVYGTFTGNSDVIRSIATLAFDCRRPELFRPQLISALRIVERGDLTPKQMRGAWAGEMGQTQFMATDYYESAVDFDGDGKKRLKDSSADALASTANLMQKWGWQRGQPWIEEVRVPTKMDWKEADLAITHPRSTWAAQGVTKANGQPLAPGGIEASLLLPMGRNGPAFLAYPNFRVYLKWNESLTYALTAAYFATRLNGAPAFRDGNARVASFGYDNIVALQRQLAARGYDVGDIDGKLGAKTRAAIKDLQIKLGLPADSYPTPELLKKLQQA